MNRRTSPAPHEVRIVGGRWRRSRLPVLHRPGLRPTPDRVRETLFNWLGQDLTGWRCVDAFAGSGALGFEAASRGAAAVWMIEAERDIYANLMSVRQRLGADVIDIECADAPQALVRATPGSWDLIFLDPPFGTIDALWLLETVRPLLTARGLVYVESARPVNPENLNWHLIRQGRAGQVHFHLLRPATLDPGAECVTTAEPGACP